MRTKTIKGNTLLICGGWSVGVLIATVSVGHMTLFSWATLLAVPLIIGFIWLRYSPLAWYKFHPNDCPADHDSEVSYFCPHCGIETGDDWP